MQKASCYSSDPQLSNQLQRRQPASWLHRQMYAQCTWMITWCVFSVRTDNFWHRAKTLVWTEIFKLCGISVAVATSLSSLELVDTDDYFGYLVRLEGVKQEVAIVRQSACWFNAFQLRIYAASGYSSHHHHTHILWTATSVHTLVWNLKGSISTALIHAPG